MRIIAGKWKGFPLAAPKDPHIRPTSDRLRETIFNILNSYFTTESISFDTLNVLDVFAGTGALGLEALSRGAKKATFIEKRAQACRIIYKNMSFLRAEKYCTLIQSDALSLKVPGICYELVFLDPPYNLNLCIKALDKLFEQQWLGKGAFIILETSALEDIKLSCEFKILDHRIVGRSGLWIVRNIKGRS
jgi:16S rRNA (guanine966-N2)-methyltransferase